MACHARGMGRVRKPLTNRGDDLRYDLTPEEHARRRKCVVDHIKVSRDSADEHEQE